MATSLFTNAKLVNRDQFLLGMKNQQLHQMLKKRLKLEPSLMMHQVLLKEAIALEREKRVKMQATMAPV